MRAVAQPEMPAADAPVPKNKAVRLFVFNDALVVTDFGHVYKVDSPLPAAGLA
jgi:hypothetical protein